MYQTKPLLVKIGMCSVNNDPLNFQKNLENIMKSIEICKKMGCTIRVGSQLEVPGYACNDHFNEYDTIMHSWEVVAEIIKSGITNGIVCDLGCPVIHHGNLYNSRIVVFNGKIAGIRSKMILADGDNYFETRWFGYWKSKKQVSDFRLPKIIQEVTGQTIVPIGDFLIDFNDTTLGYEICEEAWISNNPMIQAALEGAEIMLNPSASHVERGKMKREIQMVREFTQRYGGCYCYTNVKGAVGDRTYFDGCCIFTENGRVKGLSEIHTLDDVIVTAAVANLTYIRTFRLSNKSFLKETKGKATIPRVQIDFNVAADEEKYLADSQKQVEKINKLIEIYEYPNATYESSMFLWDYLRKSRASGYFLALSGGLDSCCVALIVYNMCVMVYKQIVQRKNATVLSDLRKILSNQEYNPQSPKQICNYLFFTCYMATDNSSKETTTRAETIASSINSHHRFVNFQQIFQSFQTMGTTSLGVSLSYMKNGGNDRTDKALQNVQARSRMLLSYFFAQVQLEVPKRKGFLLVLGASNLCESLRGYFTKYDCSSADINPIGSFSKAQLKEYLKWNKKLHGFEFIDDVLNATPTAQLRPLAHGEIAQTDEEDMGLTYEELHYFGKLRRQEKLGPVSMFQAIYSFDIYPTPQKLAEKVKLFFKCYAQNRHKMTTITPSFHFEPEGCDDNRLDMRPIIYATDWSYQFKIIDEKVKRMEAESTMKEGMFKRASQHDKETESVVPSDENV